MARNSSAKLPLSFDEPAAETSFNKRKAFSYTLVTKVAKPAYAVKLTKAQTFRTESNKMKLQAIENKRIDENIAKNPFEFVTRSKVEVKPMTAPPLATTKQLQKKPLSSNFNNVQRIFMLAHPSNNSTGALSSIYKKVHENILKKQKSIADFCKCDNDISISISRAYELGFKSWKDYTLNANDKENVTHRKLLVP